MNTAERLAKTQHEAFQTYYELMQSRIKSVTESLQPAEPPAV
jgi:hypothetical protein